MSVLLAIVLVWGLIGLGAFLLERRSTRLGWALTFSGRASVRRTMAEVAASSNEQAQQWGDPDRNRLAASAYEALAKKYRYYAARPWLSVPPDPPMPEG